MKYRIVYFYAKLDKIKDIKGHITHLLLLFIYKSWKICDY